MPLNHTTIINLEDQAVAEQQYQSLIDAEVILMIVLGNTPTTAEGVEIADGLAPLSPPPRRYTRKVMWIKDHIMLKDKLEPFLHAANLIQDNTPYEKIKCFCLSFSPRKAQTRIHKNGIMDDIWLERLYIEAERQTNS